MSKGVIVCTHGNSAIEMVKTVEMIMGKQESVKCIDFVIGESLEDLKKKYLTCIETLNAADGILICVDLLGGSPFNTAVSLVETNSNLSLVTGVNIPMLIEVFSLIESLSIDKLADHAADSAKNGVNKYIKASNSVEEDDF